MTDRNFGAGTQDDRHSAVWTLALAATLVGIAALPRRRGGDRPEARSETRSNGPRAEAPSHAGGEAKAVARTEADRGRQARSPSEIPGSGWKDVGLRVFRDLKENRLVSVAAGVTFYVLLAIFPAVAALVSCYGLFADVGTINDHLASLQGVMPSGAIDIVGEQVKRIAAKGDTTLGITFFTGIVLSVWSANGGMKAIFDALNIVYEERETRNFVRLNLRSLAFTAGALLFIILALGGIVVLPVVFNTVGLSAEAWYIALLRWPALFAAVLGGLALLYRYGPCRDAPRWRWVTWGSALAAFAWLAGSLGAVIGFMTWIWISTVIVLIGAEVNAEMEHQTVQDTTVGAPQPLGARRAKMADTVGVAT